MEDENYEKIYDETKKFYWSIRSIICPALNNEKIIFHGAGWRHLIFKKGVKRPIGDQVRRFYVIKHIERIITDGEITNYKENVENGTLGKFWKLKLNINNQDIYIVIRQFENGPKHFFSIMN